MAKGFIYLFIEGLLPRQLHKVTFSQNQILHKLNTTQNMHILQT